MCQLYLKHYSPKIHVRYFVIGHNIRKLISNTCDQNWKYQLYVVCFVQNFVTHFIHKYKCKSNGTKNDRPMYLKKNIPFAKTCTHNSIFGWDLVNSSWTMKSEW